MTYITYFALLAALTFASPFLLLPPSALPPSTRLLAVEEAPSPSVKWSRDFTSSPSFVKTHSIFISVRDHVVASSKANGARSVGPLHHPKISDLTFSTSDLQAAVEGEVRAC